MERGDPTMGRHRNLVEPNACIMKYEQALIIIICWNMQFNIVTHNVRDREGIIKGRDRCRPREPFVFAGIIAETESLWLI